MEQNNNIFYAVRDLTGQKLGTCLLEKMIGQGGMGEVYLAHQERPERRVAVKTLRAHVPLDSETARQFRARFQREANLIARLDHVNIMPIYEYGEQADIGYLVMPYLTGGSLRDLLQKQGALAPTQVLIYLEQTARALDYAHEQGIVHRDLKPANFLLHADGRLVLADFGIARILADESRQESPGTTLTGTGMLLGTPEYMAPEMVRGEAVDKRADIYELGIVLYQMLSGSVPFKGNTPLIVAIMQLQEPLPSLHASHPTLPPALDAVLQKATAKLPAERFQTAGAMVQAFREALRPSDITPSPITMNAATLPAQRSSSPVPTTGTRTPPPASETDNLAASQPSPSGAQSNVPTNILPASQFPQTTPQAGAYIASPSGTTYPQTPYPPAQQPTKQKRRQPWLIILSTLIIILLVGGGVLLGLQLNRGNGNTGNAPQNTPGAGAKQTATSRPTSSSSPSASPTPLASPSVTSTPVQTPGVPRGSTLYSTNAPGSSLTSASCDGGNEQWADYNSPNVTCQQGNVTIHNPQQALAGVILLTLPDDATFPSNYVVEAQIQQESGSTADFGLYFRNQPGTAQGIYTYLIHPDGSWSSYVYNNTTGAPTQIGTGGTGFNSNSRLTLDVVVNSSSYTYYVNGQQIGQAHDATYLSGTAGIVLEAGGTIDVSSFALYNLT